MDLGGLTLFKRDSGGILILAAWHNPTRPMWAWRLSWQKDASGPRRTVRLFRLGSFQRNISLHLFGRRILRLLYQPEAMRRI